MDNLQSILHGFSVCLQPINLWYTFVGVLIGSVIGVLPGIGPTACIALLVPVTFGMNPTSALIMMAGIYYGAQYGGSTTSILINTPGESSSLMTCIDGYQMARKGRAGAALAISAWGSLIAGTIGTVAVMLLSIPMMKIALRFGPAEYFTLMLFSMTAVASLSGDSPAKGMFSTMLGLMLSTVGVDLQSGQMRYTMGITQLQDGVGFIQVMIGMLAVGEVFISMEEHFKGTSVFIRIRGKLLLTREEWKRSVMPILRGTGIGFFVGMLPGVGATIATIISYTTEKRVSKHPEEFGQGAIEGVAGPEAANNASCAGGMVPLLSLGVPGGSTTAVLLGVLILYGIQPGPLLFQHNPDLVWGLIDSMYLGNFMLLILNLPLIGIFVRLLYIPTGILLPLIIIFSAIGVYAIGGYVFDLYLSLVLFGALGYLFRKIDIPAAPLILALVLGSMMEQSFRQAMTISAGNPIIFVSSGIAVTLIILSVISIALPFVLQRIEQWKKRSSNG